jgi:pectin methylesterase-like acyl-CoA thioesterase
MRIFTSHFRVSLMKQFYIGLLLLLAGLFAASSLTAQQIAFPGAEGAGRFTSGGRGTAATLTTVFEVTNLNDDNNPGSLRYALSQNVPYRTVVFRVSGTIHLTSNLNIRANTTIAGQTAPGDGICIADKPLTINGDNIIVRYIRVRLGDRYGQTNNGNDDAMSGTGRKNIIIDHCTMGWSEDETFTIYSGDSTTAQWNIISEPLNHSYHDEGTGIQNHGYGGIWGGRRASFHHNLIVSCVGRMPRFSGSGSLPPSTPGQENVDFRNNVIYNWGSYNVNGGEGGNYNVVNNYYKYGPSTNTGSSSGVPVRNMVINPGQSTAAPVLPYGKYYLSGNYVDGAATVTVNNWLGCIVSGGTLSDTTQIKVTTPFDVAPLTMHSAAEAYGLVLQYAGASFSRDTLDQRIVNDVINRTGRIIDVQGGYPQGTPYASTVNAWPTLNSAPAPVDTDHDGMPDAWETSNGLNPNDATDRGIVAGNGYTNLENYINGIVTAATVMTTGSLNPFVQNIPLTSAVQSYTVSGTNLTAGVTITPPAGFQVSGDGGATWFSNSSPLTIAHSGGVVNPKTINVRLNAAAPGAYAGNIVNTSAGSNIFNMPVTGNAFASTAPPGTMLVVAQDGSGDYSSVQAAINAAPTGLTSPYIIFIKNGKYFEKITVPSNKPFIQLVGESVANVILYHNTGASDPLPGGGTVGTQNSASFTVNAADFSAFNITFANTYGDGTQAVAVLVNNDRAVFKNCRFLGNQDTLYIKGGGVPRHYFKDCYIDGNVDFIFGSSVAVFDSTVVYPKSRTNSGGSYITAANTPAGQTYGYVFRNCKFPNNTGATDYVLGRPWQNSTGSSPSAHNKVVLLNARMGTTIKPEGWSAWDAGTNTSLIYYGEYQSRFFNGALVNTASRVPWSFQLNATEAASYTNANLFGAWDPCAVSSMVCANQARDIAIANFRGAKGATNTTFDWNISWAMDQIKYELFRSVTRTSGYVKINEVTASNDTAINFQLTDAIPAAGVTYYYYLVGSKAGYASHITDTISISSAPTINTAGTLQPFIQALGTPSAPQNVTVSGENLLANVVLTPPVNFEISSNGGTTWVANPSTITLTPTGNTLAATTIAIRLNAAAVGVYSDSIMLTTTGGITKYVKLSGTTAIIAASTNVTLLHWPFTLNASDSAAVRAGGVMPSIPTFNNFYVSNGTTVPAVPAYSSQFGQAFAASTNGDGQWMTTIGGPGGTLRRTHYEQFTVTAAPGYEVNVDSLYITSAFYNSSSNTRLAVVYSKSNFTADSSDVFTIPGGFANPATLLNQGSGPTTVFPLSVAGLGGVTLQGGQTLTFRLYFSCGSTSPGRYAMLKDVKVIGKSIDLLTVHRLLQHWPFTQNNNDSTAVRSPGATASVPTFNRLYVSNGTTVPTIPAYSPQFGQAFGATANGDGSWGTAAGGPGGTLQRSWYEQFTVTANTGYSLRIDSILATNAFYNTSSNTRLAVVYSLSNFVSDSTDVSSIPGGFANPITLANQTGGPTNQYSLAVAGASGITLFPGQSITFRLYFSCGSSSTGRYAMLKDVKVIGLATPATGPAPTIVTTGTLSAFTQIIGSPSAVQTYSVSGSNLVGNITITPPANYEISNNGGTTWYTNASPLVLTATNGSVPATTISVRLNATALGAYSGNIRHVTTGTAIMNVAVSGNTVPVPSITTTSTLTAFSHTVGTPSAAQTYTVAGANLLGNITITPPLNFEVSADGGTTWRSNSTPLVIAPSGGTVATTTISVRMNATAAGTHSGNITHSAANAATMNVPVTGTAIPQPLITVSTIAGNFRQILGAPSPTQTYTVSGANLSGNLTLTPPANYEISNNGGASWFTAASPLILTQTGGNIANTTITVRLNSTVAGAHAGNIQHTSSGAVAKTVALNGTTLAKPAIQVTQALTLFTQIIGTPSPSQTYTVAGTNLTGDITLTLPNYYEVSLNGSNWQRTPLTLTRNGTTLASTTVMIRLNAPLTGNFNGNIVHASMEADTVMTAVTGVTRVKEDYLIYPVPAARTIFIAHPITPASALLIFYSISGQKVATYQTQPGTVETRIDLNGFPGGLYYVEYRFVEKKVLMKFIKP